MKAAGNASIVFTLLLTAVVAASCARAPVQQAAESPAVAPDQPQSQANLIVPGSEADFRTNAGDTVYFAYNAYDLDPSGRRDVARQAAWLIRYPNVAVTLEGHADERGTREYNLALGARRANAIREMLISEGVAANRLETQSHGKERPACTEPDESCWSKNRRGFSAIRSGANS